MYTPLDKLLNKDEKRVQMDQAQHEVRSNLINQQSSYMDKRSSIKQSIVQIDQGRVQMAPIIEKRMPYNEIKHVSQPERTDHIKNATQLEQQRTEHMIVQFERQKEEQKIRKQRERINNQMQVIKDIYYSQDESTREHYREQDLGPAVNQLIDLLNSYTFSTSQLSRVVDNISTSSNQTAITAVSANNDYNLVFTITGIASSNAILSIDSGVNIKYNPSTDTFTVPNLTVGTSATIPGYALLSSPALTGVPTAPTASAGTNTTQIATTAFVQTAVNSSSSYLPLTGGTVSGNITVTGSLYVNNAGYMTNSVGAAAAGLSSGYSSGDLIFYANGTGVMRFYNGSTSKVAIGSDRIYADLLTPFGSSHVSIINGLRNVYNTTRSAAPTYASIDYFASCTDENVGAWSWQKNINGAWYSLLSNYCTNGLGVVQWIVPGTNNGGDYYPGTDNTWRLGVPTVRWNIVHSANGVVTTSDATLKNYKPLPYGLREVMSMKPIQYSWKDDKKQTPYYGFCAQDLQPVLPELVYTPDDYKDDVVQPNGSPAVEKTPPLQINYTEIIPVLTSAIQQQQSVIQSQEKRISSLEAQLASLKATVDALVAKI